MISENERIVGTVGDYLVIEKRSFLGYPYVVWEKPMPRVAERIRDVVVYLYPSEEEAHNASTYGGTGFLANVRARTGHNFTYVVTNRHVIERDKAIFIRVNTRDRSQGHDVIEGVWEFHQNESSAIGVGDDVAACEFFQPIDRYDFLTVQVSEFVTPQIIKDLQIGLGEDLFLTGRFFNHAGTRRNYPTVRFGTIAMMLDEPIIYDGYAQDAFLVEIHTIPGYSGSPVFVHIPADRLDVPGVIVSESDRKFALRNKAIDKFLGIEWGGVIGDSISLDFKGDKRSIELPSGMSGVIPAWKIADVLNSEKFKMRRDHITNETKHTSPITLTGNRPRTQSTMPKRGDPISIPIPTEREVLDVFKKVTRKRKPS